MDYNNKKIIIAGKAGQSQLAGMYSIAAETLGINFKFFDFKTACFKNIFIEKFYDKYISKKPVYLNKYSKSIIKYAENNKVDLILTTNPILSSKILNMKRSIPIAVYLADDPFFQGKKYLAGLDKYDFVFSSKTKIINDLKEFGCKNIHFLPFAYSPTVHFVEEHISREEFKRYNTDVCYIGGGDKDRYPMFLALLENNIDIKLYGGGWATHDVLKKYFKGYAFEKTYRLAVQCAKVAIVNGRKKNRDEHAMRSFEIPAIGAACVVEDTGEHREIFGKEGEAVLYYSNIDEMVDKTKYLLNNAKIREKLKASVFSIIRTNENTYADRLRNIINVSLS